MIKKQLFVSSPLSGHQEMVDGNLPFEPIGFIPIENVVKKWTYPWWIREARGRSKDRPGFPAVAVSRTLTPEMLQLPSVKRYLSLAQESMELWSQKHYANLFFPWTMSFKRKQALISQGITSVKLTRWESCYASKSLAFYYDLQRGLIFCKDRLVKVHE